MYFCEIKTFKALYMIKLQYEGIQIINFADWLLKE